MLFSVIIPVRGINEYLRENISYLKKLQYKDFEVLIVVDEPENYDFSGDTRFKILTSGKVGPGEKRNIGAKSALGDILAFLDDDAYPNELWLTYASEIFSNSEVYALGAPAVTPLNAPYLEKLSGFVLSSFMASAGTIYRHLPSKARLIDDYPTVNLFVRKADFDKIGGFIKEFWPGEDTKLCLDLIKLKGRNFNYDPRPLVYHHRRNFFAKPVWKGSLVNLLYAFSPHLKQVSRYGQHRGQFARIFPDTSFRISYLIPSIFDIGLLSGWVVAILVYPLGIVYITCLAIYSFLLMLEGVRAYIMDKDTRNFLLVPLGIFLTHLVYGINFILGLIKKPSLHLKSYDSKSGNYVEG